VEEVDGVLFVGRLSSVSRLSRLSSVSGVREFVKGELRFINSSEKNPSFSKTPLNTLAPRTLHLSHIYIYIYIIFFFN
jgi:hypothetical protein